jgi:hypothetical protein
VPFGGQLGCAHFGSREAPYGTPVAYPYYETMHAHRRFLITAVAFASVVIGVSLPAGAAPVATGPKPTLNIRLEAAETIIIIRHRLAWRQQRRAYRQWLRYQAWQQRQDWYAERPMQVEEIEEPPYLVPLRQIIVRPQKKTAAKPLSIPSRPKNSASRTLPDSPPAAGKRKSRENSRKLAKIELPDENESIKQSVAPRRKPANPEPAKPAQRSTNAEPASTGKSKLLSCDAAADIIAGYAFAKVKPVNCNGTTYEFKAMRESNTYSVTMNAKDGNLLKVTKRPSSQVVPD